MVAKTMCNLIYDISLIWLIAGFRLVLLVSWFYCSNAAWFIGPAK